MLTSSFSIKCKRATRQTIISGIFSAMLVLAISAAALADGFLIPIVRPRPIEFLPQQIFTVKYHYVDVNIDNQASTTKVDQIFHNDSSTDREGIYIFPMPEGSAITKFSMYDGEKEIVGKVLDKDEARSIYESIVRQRKDPALLEYVDRNTFKASVYPVPANGDKRIKLDYTEVLKKTGTTCRYVYPLSTERFSARDIEDVRITIHLKSRLPITSIYSPTHNIKVDRENDNKATISYVVKDSKPDTDLVLYYTVSDDDLGMDLLTYKEAGEDGYFLLLASPRVAIDKSRVQPKNVVFLMDRTGSMAGEKIEQTREALKFCLNSLKEQDSFNLITYNETPKLLFNNLRKASKANIKEALAEVEGITADGGTNINDALGTAFKQFSSYELSQVGGPPYGKGNMYIVFLTDGLPTVGITDRAKILENAETNNRQKAKVFIFGAGYDVDVHLLDKLAEQTRGDADYVRPKENIEVKVSDFFGKVSDPLLANPELTFTGLKTSDIMPGRLPDIFKGSQLLVLGRYAGEGKVTVTLKGQSAGKTQTFTLKADTKSSENGNGFIPQLWASRKIGFLLDEIRLHSNKELIDEVIRLSKRYGIPTEYTSILADDRRFSTLSTSKDIGEVADRFAWTSATTGTSGVSQSSNNVQLSTAAQAPAAMPGMGGAAAKEAKQLGKAAANSRAGGAYYDRDDRLVVVNNVQNVSGRTFYQRGEYWEDADLKVAQNLMQIKQFSRAHFDLIKAYPKLAQFSTLGNLRIIMPNNQALEIGTDGKETLTSSEVQELLNKK